MSEIPSPAARRRRPRHRRPSAAQTTATPGAPRDHKPKPEPKAHASTIAAHAEPPAGNFTELGVPSVLVKALSSAGITAPFPFQSATMVDAIAGRDLLGQGRTGSGKTLAFMIPLVAQLMELPKSGPRRPQALVLVPTRELATQIAEVAAPLAKAAGRRVATVFGGVSHGPQVAAFNSGIDIIIACPGRLLDHLGTGAVDLGAVAVCVLDEADHMADQGFLPMVRRILDRTPENCQRMLFSATLAGGVDVIVKRYLDNPVTHQAQAESPVLLEHHVVVVEDSERIDTVAALAGDGRTVVFTRTKHRAKQFARKLRERGVEAVELHGNLSQNARQRNLAAFSDGSAPVLVATDIAARGIHVDHVDLVIHADPPIEHKAYTHRSGRTARAGEAGVVFTVADRSQIRDVRSLLSKANVSAAWESWRTVAGRTVKTHMD